VLERILATASRTTAVGAAFVLGAVPSRKGRWPVDEAGGNGLGVDLFEAGRQSTMGLTPVREP